MEVDGSFWFFAILVKTFVPGILQICSPACSVPHGADSSGLSQCGSLALRLLMGIIQWDSGRRSEDGRRVMLKSIAPGSLLPGQVSQPKVIAPAQWPFLQGSFCLWVPVTAPFPFLGSPPTHIHIHKHTLFLSAPRVLHYSLAFPAPSPQRVPLILLKLSSPMPEVMYRTISDKAYLFTHNFARMDTWKGNHGIKEQGHFSGSWITLSTCFWKGSICYILPAWDIF